ncbi:MAG TPA: zinc ribbon domain-containing protein [Rubrobacter sp.]|nr:zinc ribbon domain-containing protein [Rubrobacter sp.]
MADQAPCPRCRRTNPLENRFCGSCGTSLGAGSDLVARQGNSPTVMGHALPVKPEPVGKALAVGLVTLAVRAGLSWLHHKTTAEDRSSTLTTRGLDTAVWERLLGQSLEEVLIQELEEDYRSRTIAWRAIRSIVVTEWTSSSRRSAGRPRGAGSTYSSRASSPPFEPER